MQCVFPPEVLGHAFLLLEYCFYSLLFTLLKFKANIASLVLSFFGCILVSFSTETEPDMYILKEIYSKELAQIMVGLPRPKFAGQTGDPEKSGCCGFECRGCLEAQLSFFDTCLCLLRSPTDWMGCTHLWRITCFTKNILNKLLILPKVYFQSNTKISIWPNIWVLWRSQVKTLD